MNLKVSKITTSYILLYIYTCSLGLAQPIEQTYNGIDFVKVSSGQFVFGTAPNSIYWQRTERQNPISLANDFWISKYEISQGQWQDIMGSNPSTFKAELSEEYSTPVETVSWYDAQAFIAQLNQQAGDTHYRLPTEAEWEYVAKAGQSWTWSFGDTIDQLGTYAQKGYFKPQRHGLKQPNLWGVYDLYGNVYEWCEDWYTALSKGPCPPPNGDYKVIRGGSVTCDDRFLRSASRQFAQPDRKGFYIGLRIIRVDHPLQDPFRSIASCEQIATCGDGVLDAGEACDDGNQITEECAYGQASCTVCASNCTEQAGITSLCGDGLVNGGEECDDGGLNVNTCPQNSGPCEVCLADCTLGEGIQQPAPRVWDGEAGDGLWSTAINWQPNGVPSTNEWVVVGSGANVYAHQIQCKHLTIEAGAVVTQDDRTLACNLNIQGRFVPASNGLMPGGKSIELSGELDARVPWIDNWNTPYIFHDGASFGNASMLFRVRDGNSMKFILSENGFSPLNTGALLEPGQWSDISLQVDISKYNLSQHNEFNLLTFTRHDSTYNQSSELDLNVIDRTESMDATIFWHDETSTLKLYVADRSPPTDVQVQLDPSEATSNTIITAQATTDHPTAHFKYDWFIDNTPVANPSNSSTFPTPQLLYQNGLVRVDVYAETINQQSGPFSDTILIRNTPPIFESLEILPQTPNLNDELSIQYALSDLDQNDQANLDQCVWQVWSNGWQNQGNNLQFPSCQSRAQCATGQLVRVQCIATDGHSQSQAFASEPVTIIEANCPITNPQCAPLTFVPNTNSLDYAFWYWPTNQRPPNPLTWPAYQREMHFLTGHYGIVFNELNGQFPHFGLIEQERSLSQSQQESNTSLENLPSTQVTWEAGVGAQTTHANEFLGDDGNTNGGIARLSEGGRFMNRIDVPILRYSNQANLLGRIEIASMPRHVTLTHAIESTNHLDVTQTARIRFGGQSLAAFDQVEWIVENRALQLTDAQGKGWLFVVYPDPNANTTLELNAAHEVIAQRQVDSPVSQNEISLLIASVNALNNMERDVYVWPNEKVKIDYALLNHLKETVRTENQIQWDRTLGAYRIDLGTLAEAGIGHDRNYDHRPELHNWYGRHRLNVDTYGKGPIAIPMAFYSSNGTSLSITGGVAVWRDMNEAPIGVPIQMSKNWHDATIGQWYRLYSQPVFSGIGSRSLELTFISSRWGDSAYTASHGQLSLIGWNNGVAHWDESALGVFGESITYNPDRTYRSMVDDVRPFLVQSQDNNGRWNWTGNVGGADFLQYYSEHNQPGWRRQLSRVRTSYHAQGPNLTDVSYSGISLDEAIQADITVQMGRTDDLVRTWYHFEYTFLQDVDYTRLAFFQMAADDYSDNGYTQAVWGNSNGVIDSLTVPNHNTTGYANEQNRGIALPGQSPWVMLYDNQRIVNDLPEHYADLAYVVREFEANIGGTIITTPHINLHRTNNQNSQIGFELGLPYENNAPWCGLPCQGITNRIPAGSTVRATVEYLIPPADKSRYYGTSDYLLALPEAHWSTPTMGLELANGNHLTVSMTRGVLKRTYPLELEADLGSVAVEFSLDGGLGYIPLSIHGLMRHDGWLLQIHDGVNWQTVDQSVHGNDYWQANYDSLSGTYSLIWNIHNRGTNQYRVIWQAP
ncbi:MAG: hypothetical protein CMH49_09670 [Myxococcales bacterium]|nr:hypothetical protein [Myxococcales bacterium]